MPADLATTQVVKILVSTYVEWRSYRPVETSSKKTLETNIFMATIIYASLRPIQYRFQGFTFKKYKQTQIT